MPYYLVQLSYTKEAIKTLDEHPQNRFEAARARPTRRWGSPSAKPFWPSGTTT